MNLHRILSTVPKEWHAVARHYVKVLDLAGVPEDKIDRLIQWGLQYEGPGDEAALLDSFRVQASRLGLESHVTSSAADLVFQARDHINSGEWKPEPVPQSENAKLIEDIRAFRRQYPDAHEDHKLLEGIEIRALAAEMGEEPPKTPLKLPTTPAASRLEEIRQISRDDPGRYNADRGLQAERLALIEADLASKASAPAAEAPAAPQQQAAAE